MHHPALLFLIPVFVLLVIGGMFYVMPLLVARLGGWARLAENFRATASPTGTRFRHESVRVNSVNYNNGVGIWVTREGFFLVMSPFLRTGHDPLFIPWSEVHDAVTEKILWAEY